jgi:hypothetical protein
MDVSSTPFVPAATTSALHHQPQQQPPTQQQQRPKAAVPKGAKKKASGGSRARGGGGGGTPRPRSRGGGKGGGAQRECSICGKEYDAARPRQILLHLASRLHRAALAEDGGCDPSCSCAEHCCRLLPGRRDLLAQVEPAPEPASDGASGSGDLRGLVQRMLRNRAAEKREPEQVSGLLRCPVHAATHSAAGFDVAAILASIESGEALKDDGAEAAAVLLEPLEDWLALEDRSHVGWTTPANPYPGTKSMRTAVPVAAATRHAVIDSLPPQFVGLGQLPRTLRKPKPFSVPVKWPNGESDHTSR